MDNKGQISAELLIIMAAVLAVAFILVQSLSGTAKDASSKLEKSSNRLLEEIDNITK